MKWKKKKTITANFYSVVNYKEVYNDIMHISQNTVKLSWANILGTQKTKQLELATCRNLKIQSLYGGWETQGFVKAAVSIELSAYENVC